jgi:hypothetical protein
MLEDNIKIDLRKIGVRTKESDSLQRTVVSFCQHGNENLAVINKANYLEQLADISYVCEFV